MKKLLAAAAASIAGVVCMGLLPAFAVELSFTGSISTDGVVSISGYGNPGYVSVELIRGRKEEVMAVYANREVTDSVLADAAAVDADGAFALSWNLPPGEAGLPAAERNYTVVIGNTDTYTDLDQRTLSLYFAKEDEIDSAMEDVALAVAADSVAELRKVLEGNSDILQITGVLNDSIYVRNAQEVLESVLSQGKVQEFADINALHTALNKALGVTALNTAEVGTFDSVIQRYAEILKLDTTQYSADTALAGAMKICVQSVLKEYDLKLPDKAPEAFRTVEAIAAVNIAARGKVIDVLADYQDIFGLDTGSLSGSERNTVASKICVTEASQAYGTVQAVRKAYQDALKQEGSGSGSGTGGAGGRPVGNTTNIAGGGTGLVEIETAKTPSAEAKELFTDLDSVPWAKNYIETLAKAGIVNGKREGIFDPESPVTREEFTKMMALMLELPEAETSAGFSDVAENAWYVSYVNAVSAAGLLQGYDDGTFGVGENITREEAATLIARAADYAQCEITPAETLTFADTLDISEFAVDAVRSCQGAKIIQGNDQNQFLPRNPVTRAECAKMIFCLMDLL